MEPFLLKEGCTMNNTLIPIASRIISGSTTETVLARELHEFLSVGRVYRTWINDRIKQYGFIENEDYIIDESWSRPESVSSKARSQKLKNHHITLDMAKELAMVERNEKGREARRYFIDCEKQLKQEKPKDSPESKALPVRILTLMINGQQTGTQVVLHDAVIVRPCDLGKMIISGEYFEDEELPDIIKAATDKIIGRLPIPSTKPGFV
jgi:phage anti-repressor protein